MARDPAEAWPLIEGEFHAFIGTSQSHPIIARFGAGEDGYALTVEDAKCVVSRLNALLSQIER